MKVNLIILFCKYINKYFNFDYKVVTLAVRATTFIFIINMSQHLLHYDEILAVISILAIFFSNLLEVSVIQAPWTERFAFQLVGSIIGIATFILGIYSDKSIVFSIIILIILCYIMGLANNSRINQTNSVNKTSIIIMFCIVYYVTAIGIHSHYQLEHNSSKFAIAFLAGIASAISGSFLYQKLFITGTKNDNYITTDYAIEVKGYSNLLTFNKENNLFALRLIICVLLNFIIFKAFKIPQGYWMPMTAVLLTKAQHDLSHKTLIHRVNGTLIGALIAIILCYFVSSKLILIIILLPIYFMIFVAIAKHYGSYVIFLTIFLVILFRLLDQNSIDITFYRIINTIISAIIVFLVSKIISFYDNQAVKT